MLTTTRRPKLTLATVNSGVRKGKPNGGFVRPGGNVPPYGHKVFLIRAVVGFGGFWNNLPKGLVGFIQDQIFWSEDDYQAWRDTQQRCLVKFHDRGERLVPVDCLVLDEG